MEIFWTFFLIILVLVLWSRVNNLHEDLEKVKWQLRSLQGKAQKAPKETAEKPVLEDRWAGAEDVNAPPPPEDSWQTGVKESARPIPHSVPQSSGHPESGAAEVWEDHPSAPQSSGHTEPSAHDIWEDAPKDRSTTPPAPPAPPAGAAASGGFEFNFGKRLPVWIGGIALALSGFYLVKYSIEKGLLTEEVRVVLGILLGAAMVLGARYIRIHKPDMADATRIAQALSGAGIADLYGTVFAATTMYHMIPPVIGFAGMAMVTALAVILAVRHGMPIAILGLLGGFLTPVLIQTGHADAPVLFTYLFMLVLGFFWVIAALSWWVLAIPVLALAFLWVPVWIFVAGFDHPYFHPEDGLVLGLFILAVSAVAIAFATKASKTGERIAEPQGKSLNYSIMGGAIVLMILVTSSCNFALEDWGLYALLGAACVAMAYFKPSTYKLAPWISMGGSLAMLAVWEHAADSTYALVQLGFATLYGAGSMFLLRKRPTLENGGLLATAALGFYGLGYVTLREKIYVLMNLEHGDTLHIWGFVAIVLACVFALLTADVFMSLKGDEKLRDRLLALFTLVTTAFISIALTIEVRHDFLAVAFAGETLAICWVNLKFDIKALRKIAGIVFGVFVFLMGQQILMLCAVIAQSLFGMSLDFWNGHLPLATDPMFQLGLPMILIGGSAYLVQRHHDGPLAEYFEMATVGLCSLLLYYMTRNALHVPHDVLFTKPAFAERGLITNLFCAAGLGVAYAGRHFSRRAVVWSGTALFAMALFRVVWFDFIISNPLFTGQAVGTAFLFNALVLPYLLPVFWLWLEERPQLRLFTASATVRGVLSFILLFTYISLNVRQSFHGTFLDQGSTTNAEVYAYSAVWLMLGAALLMFGTLRKDRMMRIGSLVIMLLTILKVFLYDAGALEGLYRVFSFMGLGFSLLALSWFYSRFVFKKDPA